jgi:hypothetical protein
MLNARAIVVFAAVVLAGCIPQETGRWSFLEGPPDYNPTSLSSIQEAADNGNGEAARLMGDMYYWGDMVEPSRATAEEWWVKGAALDDPGSIERLEALRNGQPILVVVDGGAGRRFVHAVGDSQQDLLDTF